MIKYIFIPLSAIVLLLMAFISLTANINPNTFFWTSLLALGFPVLITVNFLLFVFFLFTSKKWAAVIPLLGFVLFWGDVQKSFNISIPSASKNEIKLMTWNVRNFDLYNWSNNEATRDNMMDLLESVNPDIVCFQEFYTTKRGSFNNIQRILDKVNFEDYYFGETFTLKEGFRKWGLSIFSKFPIVNAGLVNFENATRLNAFIFADLLINNDTVRVYNMHLQSISFNESDYEFFKEVKEQPQWNSNSAKVLQKIKLSTQMRAKQAMQMKAHSATFKHKTIFAGDFNEPAVTFTYKTLAKNMQDAFAKKGFGFGKTYINPTPFLKIDHVLMDNRFKILSHKIIQKDFSDHYPVVVTFESN